MSAYLPYLERKVIVKASTDCKEELAIEIAPLGVNTSTTHEIDTENQRPLQHPPYVWKEKKSIKKNKEAEKMLEERILEQSVGP